MFNTAILLGTLTALFLIVGWLIGGFAGAMMAFVLALAINFISYWFSDKIILRMYKATPSGNSFLNETAKKLALEARMPVPKVYTVPLAVPNAFATGRSPRHSAIAVTEGLIETLDEKEIEGVMAHEMAHIRNNDTLVQVMAATIAGAIAYLAQIGYYSMAFGDSRDRSQSSMLGIVLVAIFAPLAAMLIQLAISRSREYKADYTGSLLSKKPTALASALKKISGYARANPIKGNTATSHLFIVNPFSGNSLTTIFSTHPPVEKRIEILSHMKISGADVLKSE